MFSAPPAWFLLSLIIIALWGAGQLLAKRAVLAVSPAHCFLLEAALTLLMSAPLVVASGVEPLQVFLSLPLGCGVAGMNAVYCFALAKGHLALTGTLIACYPLVTAFLAVVVLGER